MFQTPKTNVTFVGSHIRKLRFFINCPLEQGQNFAPKDTRLGKKAQINNVISLEMHIFEVFLIFFTFF